MTIKNKQYIRFEVQNMAASDVMAMVDQGRLSEIKATDPHPLIKVFGLAETGSATGTFIGMGKRAAQFMKKAITDVYERLVTGLKGFVGHQEGTNSHDGREQVAEVVGRKLVEEGDTTTVYTALYIPPEHRDKDFDVVSLESVMEGHIDDLGNMVMDGVSEVTGIALGSSSVGDIPGFPGATLRAAVQAFAEQNTRKEEKMTKEELEKAIKDAKEAGLSVLDLLEDDELKENERVKKLVLPEKPKEEPKKPDTPEDKKPETPKPERPNIYKDKAREQQRTINKYRLGEVLPDIAKKLKLNEQDVGYIIGEKEDFVSYAEDDADLRGDIDKFVGRKLNTLNNLRKTLGAAPPAGGEGGDEGFPTLDGTGGASNWEQLSDPKHNDLIPR